MKFFVFVKFTLVGLSLLPTLQAVVPTADGCYPNFTTVEGCDALNSLTTGVGNTGVGWRSLFSNNIGSFNTGVGAGALVLNTADSNTAVGAAALLLNSIGTNNTAVGTEALLSNTTGPNNTAMGFAALSTNTTGSGNTAVGFAAALSNTTGGANTAMGFGALAGNTTAGANTAIGFNALASNNTGVFNTAIGSGALVVSNADSNNAMGHLALAGNTTGFNNTAVGNQALFANTTGSDNVALGTGAGSNATTGIGNVYIGAGESGVASESHACYIASIFGQTAASGIPVLINSSDKLGTTTSSKRFKEDIKPMDKASEPLFSLKPVSFRYKKDIDPTRTPQLGLVAEDVEKVNPDLVVRDKEGKAYSVRYEQVNAMLLNEFLKEHREVQDLKTTVAQQQKQIEALTEGLQKVSARLTVNKTAPQTASNDR